MMIGSPLILGGFIFEGFEVPNKINFGGIQRVVEHVNVGGLRTVDATGPVPEDISWSGRFRGLAAIPRAQALNAMRISGAEVMLTWLGIAYNVVVVKFTADTEKAFEVPYSITCKPTGSEGGGGGSSTSLDGLVGDDMISIGNIL